MEKREVKCVSKKYKHTPNKIVNDVNNIGPSSYMDNEIEVNYASDEFGSSDSDASNNENVPKYDSFRVEELDRNYKFKIGLEFVSLDEFIEAVTKWLVLNGREI